MARLTIAHPLPDPLIDLIAHRFRVLGEPMRIKLLDRLREGAVSVQELQDATGGSQQNVSKHLGVLARPASSGAEERATSLRYGITDEGVFNLCEEVCGGLRRQLDELDSLLAGERETMNSEAELRASGGWPLERVLFAMAGT